MTNHNNPPIYQLFKIALTSIFLGVLIFIVMKSKLKFLLMSSLIYFVIGLLFFFYLLITELKYYPKKDMKEIVPPRRKGYYSFKIYNIIIAFNVCSFTSRIAGSIFVLIYRNIIRKIELRSIFCFNPFQFIMPIKMKNWLVAMIFLTHQQNQVVIS